MSHQFLTRRNVLQVAAVGAIAATSASLTTKSAMAYQGNMERAIGSLREAREFLRESTPDKGGHKMRAIELIDQAIAQTRAGIEFAADHFGD